LTSLGFVLASLRFGTTTIVGFDLGLVAAVSRFFFC